jgi:hypothetical protein
MGCECQKPDDQSEEINAQDTPIRNLVKEKDVLNEQNNNNLSSRSHNGKPEDSFSRYIFEQINALRENPQSFIDKIEKAKSRITIDEKTGIKIYKSSVKVALNKGEQAFDEAIEFLKNTEPMKKLKFNPDFVVELPRNELDVKSKEYLMEQVKYKIDSGIDIKSFWKDIVSDAESCFILTVVDDSGLNDGNKRLDILNKDNKYIGITSVRIGRSFACYIVIG